MENNNGREPCICLDGHTFLLFVVLSPANECMSDCLYREITLYGVPYMLIAQVGHH